MEEKELSPEEKLLRLIKKGKPESAFGPEDKVKLPKAKKPLSEPEKEEASKERILFIKKREKPLTLEEEEKQVLRKEEKPLLPTEEGAGPPQIKAEKRILIPHISYIYAIIGIVIFLLLVIFMFSVFTGKEVDELERLERLVISLSKAGEEKPIQAEGESPKPEVSTEKSPQPKPATPFEQYEKLIREKSIFVEKPKGKSKNKVSTAVTLREMTKDLRLVGIVPGDEPQVIVEDRHTGQTLFLKKGEMIGDIEITDILSGKIILSLGDETTTLSL